MQDKRENPERRSGKDRRSGGRSDYIGPERRSQRFRRDEAKRRKKKT